FCSAVSCTVTIPFPPRRLASSCWRYFSPRSSSALPSAISFSAMASILSGSLAACAHSSIIFISVFAFSCRSVIVISAMFPSGVEQRQAEAMNDRLTDVNVEVAIIAEDPRRALDQAQAAGELRQRPALFAVGEDDLGLVGDGLREVERGLEV